jgi:hypothetical protein
MRASAQRLAPRGVTLAPPCVIPRRACALCPVRARARANGSYKDLFYVILRILSNPTFARPRLAASDLVYSEVRLGHPVTYF